jgi:hypothetical protein
MVGVVRAFSLARLPLLLKAMLLLLLLLAGACICRQAVRVCC